MNAHLVLVTAVLVNEARLGNGVLFFLSWQRNWSDDVGAAQFLEKRADDFKDVYYRGAPHFTEAEKSLNLGMFDLLDSLKEILDRAENPAKEVLGEEFPIEEKIEKILFLLEDRPSVPWEDIFADERKRRGIIACFLAMLELCKLQRIFVRQEGNFHKIMIYKKEVPADVPADGSAAPGQ